LGLTLYFNALLLSWKRSLFFHLPKMGEDMGKEQCKSSDVENVPM
jgi:hypothetical protein